MPLHPNLSAAEDLTQSFVHTLPTEPRPQPLTLGFYEGSGAFSQLCKPWCLEQEGAMSPPSPSQLIFNTANWILFEYVSEFKDLAVVSLSATAEALMTTSWVKEEAQTWKNKWVLSLEKAQCHSPNVGGGMGSWVRGGCARKAFVLLWRWPSPGMTDALRSVWDDEKKDPKKKIKYTLHCYGLRGTKLAEE